MDFTKLHKFFGRKQKEGGFVPKNIGNDTTLSVFSSTNALELKPPHNDSFSKNIKFDGQRRRTHSDSKLDFETYPRVTSLSLPASALCVKANQHPVRPHTFTPRPANKSNKERNLAVNDAENSVHSILQQADTCFHGHNTAFAFETESHSSMRCSLHDGEQQRTGHAELRRHRDASMTSPRGSNLKPTQQQVPRSPGAGTHFETTPQPKSTTNSQTGCKESCAAGKSSDHNSIIVEDLRPFATDSGNTSLPAMSSPTENPFKFESETNKNNETDIDRICSSLSDVAIAIDSISSPTIIDSPPAAHPQALLHNCPCRRSKSLADVTLSCPSSQQRSLAADYKRDRPTGNINIPRRWSEGEATAQENHNDSNSNTGTEILTAGCSLPESKSFSSLPSPRRQSLTPRHVAAKTLADSAENGRPWLQNYVQAYWRVSETDSIQLASLAMSEEALAEIPRRSVSVRRPSVRASWGAPTRTGAVAGERSELGGKSCGSDCATDAVGVISLGVSDLNDKDEEDMGVVSGDEFSGEIIAWSPVM